MATQRNISFKKKNDEREDKGQSPRQFAGEDPSYSAELTPELVYQAVKANGYVPVMHENSVSFKVQGEIYAHVSGQHMIL